MTADIKFLWTYHLNFWRTHSRHGGCSHLPLRSYCGFFPFLSHQSKNCVFFVFRSLDLSFNLIKTIENLNSLSKLKKLFFVQNKISKIVGLQSLQQLEMLELGANKIRVRV